MTSTRHELGRFLRTPMALAGAALLVLVVPHVNPWDMSWIRSSMVEGVIRLELAGRELQFPRIVWIAGIAAAALAALAAVRRKLGRADVEWPRRSLLLACAAFLVFTLIPADRSWEVVLELVLAALGFALLVAGAAPLWNRVTDWLEPSWQRLARAFCGIPPRVFLGLVFSFVLVGASVLSWALFGHMPHVVDAIDQLFHAKILLEGGLWAPSPEPREFFDFTHMINDGRWYSQYPPGHTALLALGHLLRAPWLIGPLLGALSVVLLYFIGKEIYDERTARLAALLGCLSPFILLMSSSFMNHISTLVFLELFLLGFVRMVDRAYRGGAALAGAALGYAFTIRPLTAAAFGAPFALYAALALVRPGRRGLLPLALVAVGAFAIPLAGLLAFNQATNGDPFLFGYEKLYGESALPGFGRSGFWREPHDAAHGFAYTLKNFNALNQYLLALPGPALALALMGMTWRRLKLWDGLLLASATSLAGAYFFYWYQDWAFGPRFLYCSAAPFLLLSAAGALALPGFLGRLAGAAARGRMETRVVLALVLALGYGLITRGPVLWSFYSRNFADGNRVLARQVLRSAPSGSVVLVPSYFYPSLFPQNDPLLRSGVVYAKDLGFDKNQLLQRRFSDRRFYKVFSFEDYVLVPYDEQHFARDLVYPVHAQRPLTIEALSFQVSSIQNGFVRDQRMGEYGGEFRNHDQLRVTSRGPGAEIGFRLWADRPEERTLSAVFAHAADLGIVDVRVNGERICGPIDLYSPNLRAEAAPLGRARLLAGANALAFRVAGKNERSTAFGMGLDYVVVE